MPTSQKPRILIVDDNPDNIHVLMDTLKEDYAIVVANNGKKALNTVAANQQLDLILLDVMMPGIDGYEVCRRLKADEATQDIPVLFITALSKDYDEARGLELGAVDYITKPFNPNLVKARVRNQLTLHVARRKIEAQAEELRCVNHDLTLNVQELKKLHEQRSELLGMAVHDLKNPLSAISGLANLLKMRAGEPAQDPEKTVQLLDTIVRSSDHMLQIIDDMLASEKIDSGQLEMTREPRDLVPIAAMVCELNLPVAARKKIALEPELNGPCIVHADGPKMREIIDNLVSNAIKFSPASNRVWVRLYEEDGQILLDVEDEGPGLTEDDLEKVFGRFQKLSARPTGGESSTGLGLSIVKRLVELHDGQVQVASTVGKGTTFTVRLPVCRV